MENELTNELMMLSMDDFNALNPTPKLRREYLFSSLNRRILHPLSYRWYLDNLSCEDKLLLVPYFSFGTKNYFSTNKFNNLPGVILDPPSSFICKGKINQFMKYDPTNPNADVLGYCLESSEIKEDPSWIKHENSNGIFRIPKVKVYDPCICQTESGYLYEVLKTTHFAPKKEVPEILYEVGLWTNLFTLCCPPYYALRDALQEDIDNGLDLQNFQFPKTELDDFFREFVDDYTVLISVYNLFAFFVPEELSKINQICRDLGYTGELVE